MILKQETVNGHDTRFGFGLAAFGLAAPRYRTYDTGLVTA
jgi:hypothetical protein